MNPKRPLILLYLTIILIAVFLNRGAKTFGFQEVKASEIQMNLSLGYGGYVSPEHWVPLRVEINGKVDAARIELTGLEEESGHRIIENYAMRGLNRAELPVFAAEHIKALQVRLFDGTQLITEQTLDMKTKIFPGQLVLTVDLPVSAQQTISGSLLPIEPVLVVPLDIHELPGLSLNYEGVSGLVINNFKPLLAPAQLKALRSWVTGGGRIIAFGTDQDLQTMVKSLTQGPVEFREGSALRVGLGVIRVFRNDIQESSWTGDAQIWRQFFALKRSHETLKLNTIYCFPDVQENFRDKVSFPWLFTILTLVIWAIIALFIVFLNRKTLIIPFLIFTLISSVLAFPVAGYLGSSWRRGAVIHTRAVILPEHGGLFMNMPVQMNTSIYVAWYNASPWGIDIAYNKDEEGGIFLNRRLSIWNHHTSRPFFTMRTNNSTVTGDFTIQGKSRTFDLTGWFPDVSLDLNPEDKSHRPALGEPQTTIAPATAQTVSWDGKQWRLLIINPLGDREWMNISSPPPWFAMDQEWLKKLQLVSPDTVWIGGRSILPPELRIEVQKSKLTEVFWAMPYIESEK